MYFLTILLFIHLKKSVIRIIAFLLKIFVFFYQFAKWKKIITDIFIYFLNKFFSQQLHFYNSLITSYCIWTLTFASQTFTVSLCTDKWHLPWYILLTDWLQGCFIQKNFIIFYIVHYVCFETKIVLSTVSSILNLLPLTR